MSATRSADETPKAGAGAVPVVRGIGVVKRTIIRIAEIALYPAVRWLGVGARPGRLEECGDVKSILVIEYWHLGDMIVLLPFLRQLRAAYPAAGISVLINPSVAPMLEAQRLVDELIPLRAPWVQPLSRWRKYSPLNPLWGRFFRVLAALRRKKFELALSGRMDFRDHVLMWALGATRRVGLGAGGGAFLLTDAVPLGAHHQHRAQQWLALLEHLGIRVRFEPPRLDLTEGQQETSRRFLAAHGIQESALIVGIHPGARVPLRRWGDANFAGVGAALQSEFSVKIFWFCEPGEDTVPESLAGSCVPVRVSLDDFIAVLARCCLLICNDSGPMHIASALGVPVVAVFGPQNPAWLGPLGPGHRVVYQEGYACRPCFDYCIYSQPWCLRDVAVSDVHRAARASLSSRAGLSKVKAS